MPQITTPFLAQLYGQIIVPTLGIMDWALRLQGDARTVLDSQAARNLLLGTVAQESGGRYLAQYPSGPAIGLWEIEPATHSDLLINFVGYHAAIRAALNALAAPSPPLAQQLGGNLFYACAVARLLYYRAPAPLPDASDVAGLGAYWKQYYNTAAGAGAVDEFVTNFSTLIGAPPDA